MARAKKREVAGNPDETFDEREFARRLKISPKSVYRLRKKGEIPFYRIGILIRYDDSCVAAVLARNRREAA